MALKKSGIPNGSSKSEQYLLNRSDVPSVSALMARDVSQFRRNKLADEVEMGLFRDGSEVRNSNYLPSKNGLVVASTKMAKHAQITSGSNNFGNFRGANGDAVKQAPEVYSPLWLNSNLSLPRDRATINAWCRAFYALNPFVHNAINLHSTYPISKLNIKCANKEIENFFNNMIEETDLMNICVQVAQEFFLLGEAFVCGEFDESRGTWSSFVIQNPDYMIVKRTVVASEPAIMLRPDENLKKIIFSNRSADIEQRKQLPQYIIDSVKRGDNIPLNNMNVSHLARRISPYEIRGTGLPVCIFRQLMLFDSLRESKFAQAQSMINPMTLIKIGSEGPDGQHPTAADLEGWRDIFEASSADKDFKIFTHPGVTVEKIGSGAGIYDISGDITQIVKEIFIGLQVPSVLMDGGADTSYANGSVALDSLKDRYMQFRNMMSNWLKRKIFAPICEVQGFYKFVDGKKELIIPEVDWNHMSLFETDSYINNLVQLTAGQDDQKRASLHTLYRSLGLEYEDEIRKKRKEAIQDAILKKEKAALDTMDLASLRTITEEDEISEPEGAENATPPADGPVPGESSAPSGLDLGGLPGMGSPPEPPSPSPPPSTPPVK